MQVVIDKHPVRFFVHKRPHVDFFLEVVSVIARHYSAFIAQYHTSIFVLDLNVLKCVYVLYTVFAQVSQWYELVVFTASMEIYGSAVADKLDNNRNILKRRYYRQVLLQTGYEC